MVVGSVLGQDTSSDQVVTTWMGDCLRTGKPSWYIISTKVNSAFHPSGVSKSNMVLFGWGYGGARSTVSAGT